MESFEEVRTDMIMVASSTMTTVREDYLGDFVDCAMRYEDQERVYGVPADVDFERLDLHCHSILGGNVLFETLGMQ